VHYDGCDKTQNQQRQKSSKIHSDHCYLLLQACGTRSGSTMRTSTSLDAQTPVNVA
jgi:hypothetical protein